MASLFARRPGDPQTLLIPDALDARAPRLAAAARDLDATLAIALTSWIRPSPSHSTGGAIDLGLRTSEGQRGADLHSLPRLRDTIVAILEVAARHPDVTFFIERDHLHLQDPSIAPLPPLPGRVGAVYVQATDYTRSELQPFIDVGGLLAHLPASLFLTFEQ